MRAKSYEVHGGQRTRLYSIWVSMRARCTSKTHTSFHRYGGRGISVCQEWHFSFATFREWAAKNGYKDTLELDRIDVYGNYEPANCRWVTRSQNMANTRKRIDGITSKYKGVDWLRDNKKWRARVTVGGKRTHIGCFDDETEAARAYDMFAKSVFGDYARTNFSEPT